MAELGQLRVHAANVRWVCRRSNNSETVTAFGLGCDVPLPADDDGDGRTDVGGRWMETAVNSLVNRSSANASGMKGSPSEARTRQA